MEIGIVTPEEHLALFALLAQHGLPTDGLCDHVAHALVARADGVVVGSAALELYGRAALLRSVAVAEPHRGRGLGQALTRAALILAQQAGVHDVYLLTETAGGFFPRLGFVPIERAAVAPAVRQSVEFTAACPRSALVMRYRLP